MKKILILFLICSTTSFAQKKLSAGEITTALLKTTDGQLFRMYETRKHTASVFVFLLPDCPACENYSRTLNLLAKKYEKSGIRFYGVFPQFVKVSEVEKYRRQFKINFPLLMDFNKELLNAFDASIAPSVFVISETALLLYRGRIDDWMYAVGKKRTVITQHELEDALAAIASQQKVPVETTKAVGCIIN